MQNAKYIVGIDLGTTNCAVAFANPSAGAKSPVEDFPIPQLQRLGEVSALPLLPSCLYVSGDHELPAGSIHLPWGDSPPLIAGEFARWQGARVAGRLIASAKSWLCHPGVDRSAPILPWGAPNDVSKVSPVDASARLLGHMAAAWDAKHKKDPLAHQEVVITVPASFDEVARALTVTAARQAGLENFTLVEEPQAAFYDFTSHHRNDLAKTLKGVHLVLVVDVGGGTSDFTLIQVGKSEDGVALQRIAVGEHLMLGGDNMDAALARKAEESLLAGGRKLSSAQWLQLVQSARAAKESLLGPKSPAKFGISLAADGSRLLGNTLSTEIQRADVEKLVLEGFLPQCAPQDSPQRIARTALKELGLPYAQDPAITRHLVAFLRQHSAACFKALGIEPDGDALPRPDAILLNGGVFNSAKIVKRLADIVSSWWPDSKPIRLLPHDSLDFAVARGAAYYGMVRRGLGRRIGGGAAHAFYVGLAGDRGVSASRAVCLIPRGHEEGETVDLRSRPFELTIGRPVQFPLYSTTSDRVDEPGDVVDITDDFRALPPIHTLFKGATARPAAVPVHLRATLTELGTLELWCVADAGEERWRLEFELRRAAPQPAETVTESLPPRFGEVRDMLSRVFGNQPLTVDQREVKNLFRNLEKIIGPREDWRPPLLRELWTILIAGAKRRRRSPDHERLFFQLVGYSLRPGFGYPLDEWRCEQTYSLFAEGVTFHAEHASWSEYWIMWRRISGGLTAVQQQAIWIYLKPWLARRIPLQAPKDIVFPKGPPPRGFDEMVRAAAALEHLDPLNKTLLGSWIVLRLENPETAAGPWAWSLGRLGTRVPLYGSGHRTVEPKYVTGWLLILLRSGLRTGNGTAFAATQLARMTGDRSRDVDDAIRARTVDELRKADAPPGWLRMITEVVALEAADQARALGDTLPIGLQLND